jgi:hypothetical protein
MLLPQIISQKLFAIPAGTGFDIRNTLFFKILRANPLLARFYADFFRRHGANPSIIKDLETRSAIFFSPDQSTTNPTTEAKEGSNMAVSPNTRACTHIKVNGIRCGSPSLRGEVFCYFHQRMLRGVRTPPKSRLHPIANFEDAQAIQASLMEVSQRPRPQPHRCRSRSPHPPRAKHRGEERAQSSFRSLGKRNGQRGSRIPRSSASSRTIRNRRRPGRTLGDYQHAAGRRVGSRASKQRLRAHAV